MTQTASSTVGRTPRVGEKAPNFELPMGRQEGTYKARLFNLHEACKSGPVVVAFFPGTFTKTCAKEMACFTSDWNRYASLGAQFIGVSVDSVPNQKAWAEKHGYTVPFASDLRGRVLREWDLVWESWWGPVYKRATFIIDRGGVVRYASVLASVDLEPDYTEIQAALRGL
ncbi:MAG: redoxin domain-containing protein [Euryarchaeota archaeon]|nr:redoxin domain-containing protein [Euryarchaeota archaeon]